MKLNALRADLDKERNGTWVPYQGDIRLKLARLGNPNYREVIARIFDNALIQAGLLVDPREMVERSYKILERLTKG